MKISAIRLLTLTGILALSSDGAQAAPLTSINTASGEPNLYFYLDSVYGAGNYERVSDDQDDVWAARDILSAIAIGSTAAANQQLGVCSLCDGSDDRLIGPAIPNSGLFAISLLDGILGFDAPSFRWFDAARGFPAVGTVYSDPTMNPLGVDQMVTFAVLNRPGVYVLGFEDWLANYRRGHSDRDFNDFIVEVTMRPPSELLATPEPAAVAMLGGALLLLGASRRIRRTK